MKEVYPAHQTSILVIDDSLGIQKILSLYLKKVFKNSTVLTSSNGEEALVHFNQKPYPNLVFLDLNMPIMNGFDFYKELQKQNKLNQIDQIYLMTSLEEGSKSYDTNDFPWAIGLTKPITYQEIKEICGAQLHQ